MERWHNRVAVVTGASSGIGAAVCKDLVANGMIVVGLARRQERMDELKSNLPAEQQSRFHAVKCDVSVENDILKSFAWIEEHLGGVDVLINNAGITRRIQIIDEDNTADMRAIIDTNLMGVAICTRQAYRSMKKREINDGHVVIVNSIAGHYVPHIPNMSFNMYAPSKHAITALTEVLRQEFLNEKSNIKITSISPGAVDTEIIGDVESLTIPEFPMLRAENVSDAIVYCIQTPPNVQIHDLIIKPVGERF